MQAPARAESVPPLIAAACGVVAGGVGLGLAELVAGVMAGAPSPVLAIGALVIELQPPGAKQFMADLFATTDKLVLNVAVLIVALALSAGLGLLTRRSRLAAEAGFVAIGLLALYAALRDPLVDPVLAVINAALAVGVTIWTLRILLRAAQPRPHPVRMLDFDRRRFLGTSLALAGAAAASGAVGRILLEGRAAAAMQVPAVPAAEQPAAALPNGAELDVPGLTPLLVPNDRFYRIDTALLTPRLDAASWRLSVTGMVDRPFSLSYQELLEMPLFEQYVTIACVSNEVGGDLVGNTLWRGVRLRDLLARAGVQPGASQVAGIAYDGWSAGFPTAWLEPTEREAMVAVAMDGASLPPEHGFPARLIVPGLFGYVSATKWLTEIRLTTLEGFNGYWVPRGWAKEAPILTQSRIDVPTAFSSVPAGQVAVAGVAWAPDRGVSRVEVQVDDGEWAEATTSTPISDATWVQWMYAWQATAGDHTLRVRATDGTGTLQTDQVTEPAPDGARGRHTIQVHVG
jgi:DMSO/TMAO reductase YedYZ molybdopterin-dependent catalytic subunit